MGLENAEYYLLGDRPVQVLKTPEGATDVLAYNWATGELARELPLLVQIMMGSGEVVVIDKGEFERRLESLRATRR